MLPTMSQVAYIQILMNIAMFVAMMEVVIQLIQIVQSLVQQEISVAFMI